MAMVEEFYDTLVDISLTSKQIDYLELLSEGWNVCYIADLLSITYTTSRTYLRRLYIKFDANSDSRYDPKIQLVNRYREYKQCLID